jgi:putative zinc finger protein
VSDGNGELDKILARLDEEGHGMEEHPASEHLSSYQARELPPEEHAAVQAHLERCSFCRERLGDLDRFLSPLPEDRPAEGVADFETAAEWRRLRRKLEPLGTRMRRAFATSGYPIAAALILVLAWASYRIVMLERELATPVTNLQITTLESSGSRRGKAATSEIQSFRLGNVAIFETHSGQFYSRYRLIFRDGTGRVQKTIEAQEEDGMITVLLPKRFLAPGRYSIEVVGLDSNGTYPICDFEIRISS